MRPDDIERMGPVGTNGPKPTVRQVNPLTDSRARRERGMATDGSLLVATGPANVVGPIVRGLARLAYDNETYLVPGLPEARENDEDAAYKAFMVWFERVQVALGKHGLGYGPAKRQRRARK